MEPAFELVMEGSVRIFKFFHSWYNRRSNRKAYMGGRLISRKGGDANGGLSSIVPDVHVRHVHYCSAKLPQKEIDRPAQGKRSIL